MKKKITKFLVVFVFCFCGQLTQAQDYTSLINDYIAKNSKTFGDDTQIDWVLSNQVYSDKSKSTIVYAKQQLNGIPVYNAISSFTIYKNKVIYATNRFVNTTSQISSVSLQPEDAILKAGKYFKLIHSGSIQLIEQPSSNSYVYDSDLSLNKIPVKLLYVTNQTGVLKLAWDLNIHEKSGAHWWSVRVDANSGEIISVNDWVLSCSFDNHKHNRNARSPKNINKRSQEKSISAINRANMLFAGEQYRVFPFPLVSPQEGDRQLVIEPQDASASPFGWHDTDGVEGAEHTITRGNNVYAFEDVDGGNNIGESAEGGAELNFDFDLSFDQDPIGNLDAATTNLFYINNAVHDILFHYGFDESSGNFQEFNYTEQGEGQDYVLALAQDGSSLNNATFSTPPDGENPLMRMFLWSAVGPLGKPLTVNNPTNLAGDHEGAPAQFGPSLPNEPIIANLALAVDSNSSVESTDENDACDNLINPEELDGNIVIVRRGACNFTNKVYRAQQAGAVAVLIVNNNSDPIFSPGGSNPLINIPTIMISQNDGEALINALENDITVNASLVNDGPYQLDGDFDNMIIAHEYGHGVSNRLTGGPAEADCLAACTKRDENGQCIASTYTEQMGEGWSDYIGLILTMKEGDLGTDGRGVGTYVIGEDVDGLGIRPAKYSTDTSINPLTYGDTNNTAQISAPHGVGTVWATILWDMTWSLIDVYGFDSDIYNGTGGNNIALQLVMQGMKEQPCQPGFVDGRDAILAADDLLYGGANKCAIYKAFAARGVGLSADQGSNLSRTDQTEAFDLPTEYQGECFLSTDDLRKGQQAFRIYPNPANDAFNVAISGDFGNGEITVYDLNGRAIVSQKASLQGTTTINTQDFANGVYLVQIKGQNITQTRKLIIQ